MVAIAIFSGSVLALLSVLSSGISNTSYAKQKITAIYLNQEGIEYIRNIRDTFVAYSASGQVGWDAFKAKLSNASCQTSTGCYFDDTNTPNPITSITMNACGSSCPDIFYNSATGQYSYNSSGVDTNMSRKINVTTINADEIKISSTVYYKQGSGPYSIVFSENLFNWVQ